MFHFGTLKVFIMRFVGTLWKLWPPKNQGPRQMSTLPMGKDGSEWVNSITTDVLYLGGVCRLVYPSLQSSLYLCIRFTALYFVRTCIGLQNRNLQNLPGQICKLFTTLRCFYKTIIHIILNIFYSNWHQILRLSASKITVSLKNLKILRPKVTKVLQICLQKFWKSCSSCPRKPV